MDTDPLASPESVAAVEAFVAAVTELRGAWLDHLDFHAEPLPYLFFGEVVEWARATLPTADDALRRRVAMAANAMSGDTDRQVWNLIGVSFFEPLVQGDQRSQEALNALRPWLSNASVQIIGAFGS
jgi:hypothetical protein